MYRVSSIGAMASRKASGTSAARNPSNGKSAVCDEHWFRDAAQALHPDKPGTILFLSTGLGDERLCQRYAAGHVKPSAYFLRALLRTDQGWQWLCAVMDGSQARWWLDLQRDIRNAAELRKLDLR